MAGPEQFVITKFGCTIIKLNQVKLVQICATPCSVSLFVRTFIYLSAVYLSVYVSVQLLVCPCVISASLSICPFGFLLISLSLSCHIFFEKKVFCLSSNIFLSTLVYFLSHYLSLSLSFTHAPLTLPFAKG